MNQVVTDSDFEQVVLKSVLPVLVEFGADWCGTCHIIAPMLEEFAQEYGGRIKFCKMDIDENQRIANEYGIHDPPVILFFRNGQVADHIMGAIPKKEMEKKLSALIREN